MPTIKQTIKRYASKDKPMYESCSTETSQLMEDVIAQISYDFEQGNSTEALEEMLRFVPRRFLMGYLPDETSWHLSDKKLAEKLQKEAKGK